MLLDLDEVELIEDIGCTPSEASAVLDAVAAFTSGGTGTNSGDGGEVSTAYCVRAEPPVQAGKVPKKKLESTG